MTVKCPKCGASDGFYYQTRASLKKTVLADGQPFDCIIERESDPKYMRCCACDKKILYVSTLEWGDVKP